MQHDAQQAFGITFPDDAARLPSPRMSRMCPHCEYNLSGHPEPCACPECGREVEPGLRYIHVWLARKQPSVINGIVLAGLALLGALLTFSSARSTGLNAASMFLALLTVVFLYSTIREARKFLLARRGTTSTLLYSSPSQLGIREGRRDSRTHWMLVTHISAAKALLGSGWYLSVFAGRNIFTRRAVILIYLPYSKRTAARVRNTLRRHHCAWRTRELTHAGRDGVCEGRPGWSA